MIVGRSGHVAAYMGDDERFDYVYKCVSRNLMRSGTGSGARAHNKTLLSQGSLYVARFTGNSPADQISCPDNIAFDSRGDLWIATDGAPSTLGHCDGLFHMPLSGRDRGHLRQFLAVPREAETLRPSDPGRRGTVLVAVQPPGEDGTFADPALVLPSPTLSPTAPRPRPGSGGVRGRRWCRSGATGADRRGAQPCSTAGADVGSAWAGRADQIGAEPGRGFAELNGGPSPGGSVPSG